MMIDWIKELFDKLHWIPEAATVAGALALCFKKGREFAGIFFKNLLLYITFPIKASKSISDIFDNVESLKKETSDQSKDIRTLKHFMGHNGGGGLLDVADYLMGYASQDFWLKQHPGITLLNNAEAVDSTHAFCRLLGLSDKEKVVKGNWIGFLDKEDYKAFIEEYGLVSSRRETFRRTISLVDVFGEDVGEWTVIASPVCSDKVKAVRYRAMLYPHGEKAKKIAEKYDWPLVPPL